MSCQSVAYITNPSGLMSPHLKTTRLGLIQTPLAITLIPTHMVAKNDGTRRVPILIQLRTAKTLGVGKEENLLCTNSTVIPTNPTCTKRSLEGKKVKVSYVMKRNGGLSLFAFLSLYFLTSQQHNCCDHVSTLWMF